MAPRGACFSIKNCFVLKIALMKISLARVIVVEDDALMCKFVVSSLRRLGIQTIETCVDGSSAMKLVESFKPDLVLTDVHMEPVNGLEFVRQLRASLNEALRKTRVIIMSSDASSATLEAVLPLGTSGYIVKPPKLDVLRAKLESALR
jgi:two-component system chemotaxis response regulator CheY